MRPGADLSAITQIIGVARSELHAQRSWPWFSAFRSAIEAAGLRLHVNCDPNLSPVPVNREMWERVVSNLLSNAFKFTFEGEISVSLRALSLHAELIVADTGVGIPAHEIPNVFKRFHRVRGALARTAEGSGIGLAIVDDFVKRMGGQVRVLSQESRGTSFTIWMPYKSVRHVAGVEPQHVPLNGSPNVASELAAEASRWLDGMSGEIPDGVADDLLGRPDLVANGETNGAVKSRIVVVDDNADMRQYLQRLLSPRWEVEVSADGDAGFTAVQRLRPDILLADVMMPNLDGFELLDRVRRDPELKHTPVVLVTARAGEEAAIEGLLAGADDYIAKPFSPRELVARVQAVIDRTRAESALRDRQTWLSGQRMALEAALNGAPLATSLEALIHTATEAMGPGTRAAFYLADEKGVTLHHVVGMSPEFAVAVDGFKIGPQSLACGLAAATGDPVLTTDVQTEPLWAPWRWMAERFGYRGCWSFPIHSSAGVYVGSLAIYSQEPRAPTKRDLELASVLARTASIIISKHRETEARQRAEQAQAALRQREERLLRIVNLPGVGQIMFDIASGALIEANDAFLDMTGYTRDQIRLRELTWHKLTPSEHMAESERQMATLKETGRIGPYEKEYFLVDGSRAWMLFAGAQLDDGTIAEYCINIDEFKR